MEMQPTTGADWRRKLTVVAPKAARSRYPALRVGALMVAIAVAGPIALETNSPVAWIAIVALQLAFVLWPEQTEVLNGSDDPQWLQVEDKRRALLVADGSSGTALDHRSWKSRDRGRTVLGAAIAVAVMSFISWWGVLALCMALILFVAGDLSHWRAPRDTRLDAAGIVCRFQFGARRRIPLQEVTHVTLRTGGDGRVGVQTLDGVSHLVYAGPLEECAALAVQICARLPDAPASGEVPLALEALRQRTEAESE